jgi:hypothetical protein
MIEPRKRSERSSQRPDRFMLYAAASAVPQSGSKCTEAPRMWEPVSIAKSTEWRSMWSLIRWSGSLPARPPEGGLASSRCTPTGET